jgi:hypothetical protein
VELTLEEKTANYDISIRKINLRETHSFEGTISDKGGSEQKRTVTRSKKMAEPFDPAIFTC